MSQTGKLRVGIHPQSPAGPVLLHAPALQAEREALAPHIEFFEYGHGTQTPDHFLAGRIDVGLTGATPPLTIQALGGEVAYLATGQARPNSGALVVPIDSDIQSIEQLAGKRVGFAVGSWHSAFVALALDARQLGYEQIVPVSYVDTAGRLDRGRVDAWVARPEELDAKDIRILIRSGEVWSNRSVVFIRRGALAEDAIAALALLITALDTAGRWIGQQPAQAAALLASISPVDSAALQRGFEVQPHAEHLSRPDSAFLDEQQQAADLLAQAAVFNPVDLRHTLAPAWLDSLWAQIRSLHPA